MSIATIAFVAATLIAVPRAATAEEEPPWSGRDTVVVDWNEAAIEGVRQSRLGPPMVARALAIVHTCMFDAWAAYDSRANGTRLGGSLRRPPAERSPANKSKAISYAAYRAASNLFPASTGLFAELMRAMGYDPNDANLDTTTPAGIGNTACMAVLHFRHHDGSNQLGDLAPGAYSDYTGYTPVNTPDVVRDPNRWQPLRHPDGRGGFVTQTFVGAHWYLVEPFALTSGSQFRSTTGPATYPSDRYRAQAQDILDLTAALTDREKAMAEYWADGPRSETPPGHWNLFAQFVSRRDRHSVDQDAKMFFALNNALHDAAIVAWDNKRHYDSVRPITAIRFLFKGQPVRAWAGPYLGTQIIDGGDWKPYQPETFPTPPFPDYTSGHSTYSAAAAEVLRLFTGSDRFGYSVRIPAGSSKVEPGAFPSSDITMTFATFTQAADQAGKSRRIGGIHFGQADLEGRTQGRRLAAQVWTKAQAFITGRQL